MKYKLAILSIAGLNMWPAQLMAELLYNSQQSTPTYCNQSTLTGQAFIQALNEIINHGDLTDVAFVKKTLNTKFHSDQDWAWDHTLAPNVLHLRSNDVLGSPMAAKLSIVKGRSQELKIGYLAGLSIEGPPNVISDCLHMTRSHFFSAFGENFVFRPIGEGVPLGTETQSKAASGKNGSQMLLSFTFEFRENLVTDVQITQLP